MNIKMLIYILFSILIGYLFGKIIFNQYDKNMIDVFNDKVTLYFLQQGVYTTPESMEEHTKNLKNYVYMKDNNYYRVYAAITKDAENVNKLKEYFIDKGNDIYVKEIAISNDKFISILDQYDTLLNNTTDEDKINNIIKQTLIKYQELVVDGANAN